MEILIETRRVSLEARPDCCNDAIVLSGSALRGLVIRIGENRQVPEHRAYYLVAKTEVGIGPEATRFCYAGEYVHARRQACDRKRVLEHLKGGTDESLGAGCRAIDAIFPVTGQSGTQIEAGV